MPSTLAPDATFRPSTTIPSIRPSSNPNGPPVTDEPTQQPSNNGMIYLYKQLTNYNFLFIVPAYQ